MNRSGVSRYSFLIPNVASIPSTYISMSLYHISRTDNTMNIARHSLYPVVKAEIALSSIPERISSKQLPPNIARYARYHLLQTPSETPLDPSVPLINAPNAASSSSSSRRVTIPNPFLLQRLYLEYEHLEPDVPRKVQYRTHLNKSRQRKLLDKYEPHFLPPSPINPLPKVPIVVWEGKEGLGTEIVWDGGWGVDDAKHRGPYANRKHLFKGHKKEQAKKDAKVTIAARMEGMAQRVTEWKQVCVIGGVQLELS
jgi:hypothetical protein